MLGQGQLQTTMNERVRRALNALVLHAVQSWWSLSLREGTCRWRQEEGEDKVFAEDGRITR